MTIHPNVAVTPRPLFDYLHMFMLERDDLVGQVILDCPSGASSFGAEARRYGATVVSTDPVYAEGLGFVMDRVRNNLSNAPSWLQQHAEAINWQYLGSVDAVLRAYETASALFALDFANNPENYSSAALPHLPFPDGTFSYVFSSHLLFSYGDILSPEDHIASIVEMMRVSSGEVRIHPIVDRRSGERYAHLDNVRSELGAAGIRTALRQVRKSAMKHNDEFLVCSAGEE